MSYAAGHTLGSYRIASRLGAGGMGEVYLAEHPLIGKKVALKVIHRDLAANREVIARFLGEARAVGQIGNEHIVDVHDFGQTADGDHFYVMEYLVGHTLADELGTRGPLEPRRAMHVAAQIAVALGAAHDHQIIHRDLKPDNVMLVDKLGDPDFVKVLDFGLAKVLAADAPQLTAAGVVLGTPQYMSPEAAESRADIDHRSDIYALGILLFQMVTGRVPFDAPQMGEVLVKQVCQAPPAPRAFNAAIPPALEQIILRCLAKHPDARFATMAELRCALLDPDRYLASSPPVVAAALVGAPRPSGPEPAPAQNETMLIATPTGFVRGGVGRWPLLIGLLAIAAAGGSVAALVTAGQGEPVAAVAIDAAPVADAVAATIRVEVKTEPTGATIFDEGGVELGVTPAVVVIDADDRERTWTLRHPDARESSTTFTASAATTLQIELDEIDGAAAKAAPRPASRPRPKRRPAPANDGLLAPDL